MKFRVVIIVALTATGCSADSLLSPSTAVDSSVPTPAPTTAVLWGFVVDQSGACIRDAEVEAIAGQAVGAVMPQDTPCDVWAYGGGFYFKDLTPGIAITIRASAPGYGPREMTVMPFTGGYKALAVTLDPLK